MYSINCHTASAYGHPSKAFTPTGRITNQEPQGPHQLRPTNDNKPGGRDLVGHSSVQAWSAGPLFPAVIAKVEHYPPGSYTPEELANVPLAGRLVSYHWELTYPGFDKPEVFFRRELAEQRARELNAARAA